MHTTGLDAETLELTLTSIRSFAAKYLPDDKLLALDHADEFPIDIIRGMGGDELGIQMVFIPEQYGGMGGGAFDVYRVCEAVARVDLGVATGVLATFLGSDPIVFGGTEEQKERFLGRIASDGLLMAYAATEPQAGSDLGALKSTATPVFKDEELVGYRLNGNKQWISNGGFADLYTFLAKTDAGPCWFVIEQGTEGLSHGNPEDKHGIRASNTATVSCDDVFVEVDRLVGGEEGRGLVQAQLVFGFTRLMVAAFGLGAGWAALDIAVPYSVDRVQGGSPLSEKQGFTHKLIVPHAIALEVSRAYIEETAQRIDAGEGSLNTEGAIAKYLATEAGNAAADASIQALGGYGYTREYMVEKIKRDVRITTIYEGTSEIMEMTIARDRWQLHFKSRGQYYHQEATTLEALHGTSDQVGADVCALASHGLAAVLERARVKRLTRNQHVLFRLGELIAHVEGAGALARRAARLLAGEQFAKTDKRFDAAALSAMSRVAARAAAAMVAEQGLRWVAGSGGATADEITALESEIGTHAIHRAQIGLIDDMGQVADVLYERTETQGA